MCGNFNVYKEEHSFSLHTHTPLFITPFHILPHSPAMSSRFWQSLSRGSGRHHFEGDNEWEAEVDTGERLGKMRVGEGGIYRCESGVDTGERLGKMRVGEGGIYRCESGVDTGERLGKMRVRGGGGYGWEMEVMTSGRRWWMRVRVR